MEMRIVSPEPSLTFARRWLLCGYFLQKVTTDSSPMATTKKLTKSLIDKAVPGARDTFLWDGAVAGFGVKVSKGGRKSYVCKYRAGNGRRAPTRRFTIGTHGAPWTVDQARNEARKILGRVANGEDPAREKQQAGKDLTVGDLCDIYLEHGIATKKPSTIATDKGRIVRHIKPLLGKKKLRSVTRADIMRFVKDVAAGKTVADIRTRPHGRAIVKGGNGTATRTVGLLGGIFTFAIDSGHMTDNPVRGVKRFTDKKGDRFLTREEFVTLGRALQSAVQEGENPHALAILNLLILTGARKSEIETLKWSNVDFDKGYLRLSDSKTGQKIIPLSGAALEILEHLPRLADKAFVFPAFRGDGHYEGTPKVWRRIRKAAGLEDVRLHDLRHSFASIAVSRGASLSMIGALLGHSSQATTERYAHLHDDPLRSVTEAVGQELIESLRLGADDLRLS